MPKKRKVPVWALAALLEVGIGVLSATTGSMGSLRYTRIGFLSPWLTVYDTGASHAGWLPDFALNHGQLFLNLLLLYCSIHLAVFHVKKYRANHGEKTV